MSLKLARQRFNKHLVDYVSKNLDFTKTYKYTYKMCDFIVKNETLLIETNENIALDFDALVKLFKLFDRYSINFERKDIMQYKTYDDFIDTLTNYINNFTPVKVRNMNKVDGKMSPGTYLGYYNGYNIYRINNFTESSSYSGYCSWCITKNESTFNEYTGKNKQFYFVLKDGYETELRIDNNEPPYNDYGLSMLAIRVLPNGNFDVTTRWNHDFYDDNRWNNRYDLLDEVFNHKNIDKVLKPKENYDIKNNNSIVVEIVKLRFKCGIPTEFITPYIPKNEHVVVKIYTNENLFNLKTYEFISKTWYHTVGNLENYNGKMLCVVSVLGLSSLMDENGYFICDFWFNSISWFSNYFIVRNKFRQYNTLSIDGKINLDEWFDDYETNGISTFLRIKNNGEYNYLDSNGLMIKKNE